jgi:drug/metabolite transporter (DMT)-like permease
VKSKLITPGVKYMLLSTFWFALMNVMVKKLSYLPSMEVVFFRCAVASIIGFALLKNQHVSWVGTNRKLLFLRGLFGTIALYTFFLTLKHMPMGTAVTIQYLSPVFTTIFAVYILREKVKPIQWLFFLISFIGVLVIKGFDARISGTMLAIGLFSSVFSALAYNMVRSLKEKEHPLVVVLHFQLFGAVAGAVFTLFEYQAPIATDWIYIVLIGIVTQLGQYYLTKSLQAEKIAKVSILNYLGIIYALFFGWWLFDEHQHLSTLFGILLVVGGVVINILIANKKSTN